MKTFKKNLIIAVFIFLAFMLLHDHSYLTVSEAPKATMAQTGPTGSTGPTGPTGYIQHTAQTFEKTHTMLFCQPLFRPLFEQLIIF